MEVIKWVMVDNFRKREKFVSNLHIHKIQLNHFQHGWFTSAPNFCSKIQSTIQ